MSTPAGDNGGNTNVPSVVIVSVAAICTIALVAVAFLVYKGRDTTAIVGVIGVLSPFIVAILGARNAVKIEQVRQQVDGKMSNLITDKANLEHQVSVAGLTPITATVSFDPDSNTGELPVIGQDTPETNPPTNPYHVADLMARLAAEREQGNKHG